MPQDDSAPGQHQPLQIRRGHKKPQLTASLESAFATILTEFAALSELKAIEDDLEHQPEKEEPKQVCAPRLGALGGTA